MAGNNDNTSNRGFASMSESKHKEISSEGGKASAKSKKGAAGSTDAASHGGNH